MRAAPTYGNGQINYATDHYFNISNGLTTTQIFMVLVLVITYDQSAASA